MTKAKEEIAAGPLGSPIRSSVYDQINLDYVERMVCIANVCGARTENPSTQEITFHAFAQTQRANPRDDFTLAAYPYNPAKSIYRSIRVYWNFRKGGGTASSSLEVSLDSGSTWSTLSDTETDDPSTSSPDDLGGSSDSGATEVILANVVTSFQWILFRFAGHDAGSLNASWWLQVYLYIPGESPLP